MQSSSIMRFFPFSLIIFFLVQFPWGYLDEEIKIKERLKSDLFVKEIKIEKLGQKSDMK